MEISRSVSHTHTASRMAIAGAKAILATDFVEGLRLHLYAFFGLVILYCVVCYLYCLALCISRVPVSAVYSTPFRAQRGHQFYEIYVFTSSIPIFLHRNLRSLEIAAVIYRVMMTLSFVASSVIVRVASGHPRSRPSTTFSPKRERTRWGSPHSLLPEFQLALPKFTHSFSFA